MSSSTDPIPAIPEVVCEPLNAFGDRVLVVLVQRGYSLRPRYRVLEVRLLPSARAMRCCTDWKIVVSSLVRIPPLALVRLVLSEYGTLHCPASEYSWNSTDVS